MRLRVATPSEWTSAVLADFDGFLLDHAACERKAAATAQKLIAQYPDRTALVAAMTELAEEELEHFRRVRRLIETRRLGPTPYYKDPYVAGLMAEVRRLQPAQLLDRLLVSGIVEARACDRLGLVASVLERGSVRELYLDLTRSEARHHGLFVRLAKRYFAAGVVEARLADLLEVEAAVVRSLPLRAAIH